MSTNSVSYNPVSAVICCLKRYFDFSGRACRSEFWWWYLVISIVGWCLTILQFKNLLNPDPAIMMASAIFTILTFFPGLAVTVRRLHDTGRSGLNILWAFLPIIGPFIVFIFLCLGSKGPNQYGVGPAAPQD